MPNINANVLRKLNSVTDLVYILDMIFGGSATTNDLVWCIDRRFYGDNLDRKEIYPDEYDDAVDKTLSKYPGVKKKETTTQYL